MIYEVRTYTLKPGATVQFEENFAEALPHREKYSKLAAFWHTEIGPLNEVIQSGDMRTWRSARASAPSLPRMPISLQRMRGWY